MQYDKRCHKFYLGQDYVFIGICFFFHSFVCYQDYAKTTPQISTKFGGEVVHVPQMKPSNFGGNPGSCHAKIAVRWGHGHTVKGQKCVTQQCHTPYRHRRICATQCSLNTVTFLQHPQPWQGYALAPPSAIPITYEIKQFKIKLNQISTAPYGLRFRRGGHMHVNNFPRGCTQKRGGR